MGMYHNQHIDFVFRTQQLLKQYETLKGWRSNHEDSYEFTLLMNCFVGLLIIPQQLNGRNDPSITSPAEYLPKNIDVNEAEFGIALPITTCKGENGTQHDISIYNVIRHFRHSVAHCRFTVISSNGIIDSVIFKDQYQNGILTFELELSIENVRKLALKVSNLFLDKIAEDLGYKNFEDFRKRDENGKYYRDIHDIHIH